MHAEEGEHQVQLNAGRHGGHLHAEGRGGSSGITRCIKSLSSTMASMERFLQSISMSTILSVSTGPIFSLDFGTNLLESKAYILSLSLTAAN